MKERFKFLDITRGLAIILMVCGHCDTSSNIDYFLGLFNMSVFIFISGFLFKDRSFNNIKELIQYQLNKVKKLYIFYLKYEILFYILRPLFFKLNFYNDSIMYGGKIINMNFSFIQNIKELVKIIFGMGREPFCGAFWYIITLIFLIFGYSTIQYICGKQKIIKSNILKKIIVVISLFIGFVMQKYFNIPRFSPAFSLLIVFDFGNECYKNNKIKFNKFYFIPVCFVLLCILNNYGRISLNANLYKDPLFFIVCSFIGIYMMVSLGKLIEKSNLLGNIIQYIGQNTLIIMALHFISFKLVAFIQILVTHKDIKNLAYLNGFDNMNYWFIGYVLSGVTLPLLVGVINKNVFNFITKKIQACKIKNNIERRV